MMRFLPRFVHFLFIFLSLPLHLHAEWRSIGALVASKPGANQISFRSGETTVTLTALAPDLIRVRMTPGASRGPDYSWAVIKADWPQSQVEFIESKASWVLRTAELEVRAQLAPFRLGFYDRSGRLISKNDDSLGMAWNGTRVRCWNWMPRDEHYFGLGEKGGPLDKRGRAYVMWNSDSYMYDVKSTDPLYISIPFFIGLREGRAFGIFFDNTYRSSFDMGTESPDYYSFGAEGGELNYYFFYGPDPKKVLSRYTELVGRIPLPPRWSMGYEQTRYSYSPESTVRFIADNFRQRHIPCDALVIDIDYMDGYRVFTWDKSRFPDPARLLSDLRKQGFRAVMYMDPGVKVDPTYWVYQQGLDRGYFLKKPDGTLFIGKVWPGECAFPDFTSEKVREWWGSLYKGLMDEGAAGFENDMNEPSIFEVPSKSMDLDVIHDDRGLHTPHAKNHNVYGMLMSRATYEGMVKLRPNERPFFTTRSTFAGGQRYAAVFSGDDTSMWDGLRTSLKVLMSMGLSGMPFAGSEIGGFALSPSPELYTRWLEAGIFYPYCRTSTDNNTRNQEPWSFGNRVEDISRRSIELRYRLLPYLYNTFYEASQTGLPIMRALLLDYPDDPEALEQDYEFLWGNDLLVAPVVKDDESEWEVYLPKGVWYDFWTDRRYTGPTTATVAAPFERIPMFVRGGAILPTQQVVQYVDEGPINPLTLEIYAEGNSSRDYYEDDGISFDYQRGVSLKQRFSVSHLEHEVTIQISPRIGSYVPRARALLLKVHTMRNAPHRIEASGKVVAVHPSLQALEHANEGWAYDGEARITWIKLPDRAAGLTVRIEK